MQSILARRIGEREMMIQRHVTTILVSPPAGGIFPRHSEPVRVGIPIARGAVGACADLALADASGRRVGLQCRALDKWRDGSIRWALLDFLAVHDGGHAPAIYRVESQGGGESPQPTQPVAVSDAGDVISVDTGRVLIAMEKAGPSIFRKVEIEGLAAIDPARTRLSIDADGGPCPVAFDRAVIEESGPVRAIVRLEGQARCKGRHLNVVLRLHAFASSAEVRLDVTIHNPAPAKHEGNFWELGDPGAIRITDASIDVAWPAGTGAPSYSCSLEQAAPMEQCGSTLELWQASSGGDNWSSRNHMDRRGTIPLPFKGYRLTSEGGVREGPRASPLVVGRSTASTLAVTVPDFWQNFPRAVEGTATGLTVRYFPRQQPGGHELQGGEQKTHICYVAFAAREHAPETLSWTRAPLFARAEPAHYAASGAFPYLLPLAEEPSRTYADLVQNALGDEGFEAKRELIDEYGWRNFGDIYADHERVYYRGPRPVHSHYNNQYDGLAGLARQFARSGDYRWWRQFCQLAEHVIDIDVYRTSGDKAAYNHGLFWHTAHYADAGRSTHRSYPRAAAVAGGGPSAEHNYTTGLLYYYYLTGEPAARDTAVMLARWVIDMDDGGKTVFRWLSRADTGLASSTYEPTFQGPGRGAGHSIAALMDGYRLTGDAAYVEKAEVLIRRCIHPQDDIGAWRLLDIERRWSYTIFLHVLGRYLDDKASRGELDEMYAYARGALLVYADWMKAHERPYFDRRDELEYPTETWVAQELWKSEVFTYAAKYADHEQTRAALVERADFFFEYAVTALAASPTKTLARPLVLLLSRGLMHGYATQRPGEMTAAPGPPLAKLPGPAPYVPQKVRAVRRAIMLAGVAGMALGAAVLVWLL